MRDWIVMERDFILLSVFLIIEFFNEVLGIRLILVQPYLKVAVIEMLKILFIL